MDKIETNLLPDISSFMDHSQEESQVFGCYKNITAIIFNICI